LSVPGSPGVLSISRLADPLGVGTRESRRRACTSALVVGLPEPWVPLRHTITSPDATFNGQSTQEYRDPHRPPLDELCIDNLDDRIIDN
jgi:hypothetical protein